MCSSRCSRCGSTWRPTKISAEERPAAVRERPLRVLVAGSFDRDYARNRLILELLHKAGYDVSVIGTSAWGDERHAILSRSKISLGLRALSGATALFWSLLRRPKPDLYLVLYPGQFDMPAVGLVGRLRRVPVLFDMFISIHDTVVDRRLSDSTSVIGRLTRSADRLACRLSTRVLADTPQDLAHFADVTRLSEERFRVLWVGAPERVFRPQPETPAEDDLVLFYGTFISLQGVDTIVRAAKLLDAENVRIRLIGRGQERVAVERLIAELGIRDLELRDPVPLEALPREIARAALCLGIFGTTPKAARVVPNKVFQCIAVGSPVLTADTPAVRSAFSGEVATVPAGNPEALAEAIRSLLGDKNELERLRTAGRRRFERDYGETALARTLASYVDEIVS